MTQNEKTTKNVEVVSQTKNAKSGVGKPTQKNEYVRLRDMQENDILALPKYPANIVKNKSKKGNIYYEISIRLHRTLTITKILSETEYFLAVGYRGLNESKPISPLDVWCRFVTGNRENGDVWKRYEIYVCKALVIDKFFTDQEMALIDVAKIDLPFIQSKITLANKSDDEGEEEDVNKYKGIF